jgi:Flp pilus assembly protein TadB
MDEVSEIRERIARRTEEQRTSWLYQLRRRYSAWMFVAGVFAVLVLVTAMFAKSVLFGVVAAFLFLFACNRQIERQRIDRWLARPTPENQEQRIIWARIFYDEMCHPSVWLKITEWISAIAAMALVVTVSVVVIATTGLWMRLLYASIYFLVACLILLWLLVRRELSRELKNRIALSSRQWSELT